MSKPTTPTLPFAWYTPGESDGMATDEDGRCAAIIVKHNGDTVNLTVFDANGQTHAACGVPVVADGAKPAGGHFCEGAPAPEKHAEKHKHTKA